jgi:uncharacterized membrane protein YecN with MAPEG domain
MRGTLLSLQSINRSSEMSIDLTEEQRGVAVGMALACLAVTTIWVAAWIIPERNMDNGARSWLLAGSLLGPALTLAAGIASIARHRFLHENTIDGQNPIDDVTLSRARAYLANTTEQALLAAMVYPALAFGLSANWIAALPLCALAFVVGRVGFAIGIGRPARHRAFGFAVTFYSTISGLFVTIVLIAVSLVR